MYNSLGELHAIADGHQHHLNRQNQDIVAKNQRLRYLEQREYDYRRTKQIAAGDELRRPMYTGKYKTI